MTKEEALTLICDYCEAMKERGCEDETIIGLHSRFPPEGSEAKAMRWLGFMQGALYQMKIYSLEDLKQHSLHRKVE